MRVYRKKSLKKYGEEFEVCRTLGEHGWGVSGHSNPRYIKNWYKALIEDRIEEIIYFFEKDEDRVIKVLLPVWNENIMIQ